MKTLIVENLKITISHGSLRKIILERGFFYVEYSEIVGFLGESGSGKTTIAHALCGLLHILPYRAYSRLVPEVEEGVIRFMEGPSIDISKGRNGLRSIMGKGIFLIPQSPSASLNPYRTIGDQIREIAEHKNVDLYLEEVGLSGAYSRLYPHQLSGGMKQKVLIAMALALRPRLIIADEPTEGLDVHGKGEMLRLLTRLVRENGTALLVITHDLESLEMLQRLSDTPCLKTLLLFSGKIVAGTLREITNLLDRMSQTAENIASLPEMPVHRGNNKGCLIVRNLTKAYPFVGRILDLISFEIGPGEQVGLSGPSGSGKTTLIRCVGGIEKPDGGEIFWKGVPLIPFPYELRRDIQIAWQDPYTTLPPHKPVRKILEEPVKSSPFPSKYFEAVISEICNFLGIREDLLAKYPWQLSGGEAQRVSLARCLVNYPGCILADEPLKGLHLPEKRRLLLLLKKLFHFWGTSLLVVSHHPETLRAITERVMTLRDGRIVESRINPRNLPAALSSDKPYPEKGQ